MLDEMKEKMSSIMDQLNQGLKIQESSSNLMTFIVQDLLDFAQIKSGNFRKNISSFNIQDSIEEVMCIQRIKAEE